MREIWLWKLTTVKAELARTWLSYLAVIDPDLVGSHQRDGVSTPDVLGVELGDVNVLDDDVLGATGEPQSDSTDDSLAANTNDRLVALDLKRGERGGVVGHRDRRVVGVGAPVRAVDGILTTVAGTSVTRGTAARGSDSARRTNEVVLLVENDNTGGGVGEPRLEPMITLSRGFKNQMGVE
jgi:hypothetical protein